MIGLLASALVLVLSIAIVRRIAAVPLMRTLSVCIDNWADSVQGQDAEQPR